MTSEVEHIFVCLLNILILCVYVEIICPVFE